MLLAFINSSFSFGAAKKPLPEKNPTQERLDQCNKETPNILFIPTASAEDKHYTVNYYTAFTKLI